MPSLADAPLADNHYEPPVLGWFDRGNFSLARRNSPWFAVWENHHEFACERDALYYGLCAAGVAAQLQRVTFPAFQRWSRLTGAPVDVDGLDGFAAHWRWRARHPTARAIGLFGAPDNAGRDAVAVAGVQYIRIRAEIFERWRDDFAAPKLFAAPSLDVYAAHVVEASLLRETNARRPAVRSSKRS